MDKAPDAQDQRLMTMASQMKSTATTLEVPLNNDNLKTLCSKMTAIAEVVIAGRSIAVATAYAAAPSQERRAVQKAVSEMGPYEREAWDWYETGTAILPNIDWEVNIDASPLSAKPLKTARRRAEALNQLYKTDKARPHHSVWFTKHYLYHLPLVKAMARVIGAERDLIGGGVWTGSQLADVQSINKILSVTAQVISGQASDPLLPAITRAQMVLVSHRDSLRNLLVGRKRKRELELGFGPGQIRERKKSA